MDAHRTVVLAFAIVLSSVVCASSQTNTNGSTSYTPATPNNVSIPGMPTMYINGGGANKVGKNTAQWIHDWGKAGIEAAKDCDRKYAMVAIAALQGYLNSLDAQYTSVAKAGQDGGAVLNDASAVASVINYIRLALSACKPPQHAMLVLPKPPVEVATSHSAHHRHGAVTEDNPAYMENYHAPAGGNSSTGHTSSGSEGYASAPAPDQQSDQPRRPDVPQPPTTMPY